MHTANSLILYSKEKTGRILGTWHQYSVNVSGLCYSKQIKFLEELINFLRTWLIYISIFTLNIKQFLWKYHILPTLFWAALILLRGKQRKY